MTRSFGIDDLEQRYGFRYPTLYWRLYEDGMLTWGEYDMRDADLSACIPPVLTPKSACDNAEDPPFLWVARDFILLEPVWLPLWLESERESWPSLESFGIISFGYDSAGSGYGFWFGGQREGEETPIVYVDYVNCQIEVLARNLQDFMFRELLGSATCTANVITSEAGRKTALAALRTHEPYLTSRQANILHEVFRREIRVLDENKYFKTKSNGVLTEKEWEEIVEQETTFERANERFDLPRPKWLDENDDDDVDGGKS
jgi:hypothetical protein